MSAVNYIIQQLGNLIAPLGKNQLATLIVILALNEFGQYNFAKKAKHKKVVLYLTNLLMLFSQWERMILLF